MLLMRILLGLSATVSGLGQAMASDLPLRQKVIEEADRLLNLSNISYVYGGRQIGALDDCDQCTECLEQKQPSKDERFSQCQICHRCSLDCSNFVSLVFKRAGMRAPYLTTLQMRQSSDQRLRQSYSWINLGANSNRALPGDIIVYPGHVVILEKLHKPGIGDVVHATSGKEIRGPGLGIQRHRQVRLANYKGPLQKVLRHVGIMKELSQRLPKKSKK